jgi:hypothetical protein
VVAGKIRRFYYDLKHRLNPQNPERPTQFGLAKLMLQSRLGRVVISTEVCPENEQDFP